MTHSHCDCHELFHDRQKLYARIADCLKEHLVLHDLTYSDFAQSYVDKCRQLNDENPEEELKVNTVQSVREWIGKIAAADGVIPRISHEAIFVFRHLIPTLFPCKNRTSVEVKQELEDILRSKYGFAEFRVADPIEFPMVTADLLENEIRKLVRARSGIPRLALSGGKFQVDVVSELKPINTNNRPCCVIALNDVLGGNCPQFSANHVAVTLSQKLSGCVYAAPPTPFHDDSVDSYENTLAECELFMIGCGGIKNSFVAEFYKYEKDKLPRGFAGDLNYFPLDENGNLIERLQRGLSHFHIFGQPKFIADKVQAKVPVIMPIQGVGKKKVAKAIVQRQLANRFVLDVDLAEYLVEQVCL